MELTPSKPKQDKPFLLRLDTNLNTQVRQAARKHGVTITTLVRMCIRQGLKTLETQK